MTQVNTDFGKVADDLRRAATSFALLTSSASLFGQSLGAFREFEKQLVLTNAIAGGTLKQLGRMKQAARDFSLVTTTSAVEAGAALQQLAQAGFSAAESLAAMNGVLLLAQATMSDVRVTSDVITSNIRAFGLAASDTTRVANVFAATITGSLATMDKLAFAMRQVAPVAELAGLSIEETSAALGVLFNIGLRGEQAGTALRNIIIRLIRPLGEANDLLLEAGIATRNATGEFRNLADILTDIGNSDLSDAELARIFETEALAGAKAFIKALQTVNAEGKNQFEALRIAVTGTDRAVQLAAINLTTFDGEMLLLRNRLVDVGRTLGEAVAPTIVMIIDYVSSLTEAFNSLEPETRKSIAQFAAFGTAAIGLLASVNAIVILLRGPFLVGLAKATASMVQFATATATTSAALRTMALNSVTLVARLGALVPGIAALGAAFPTAGLIAATVSGLGLIATAAYGVSKAFDAAQLSVEEYNDFLSRETPEYNIAKISAEEVADSIINFDAIDEIRYRVDLINKELALAGKGLDLANYAGRRTSDLTAQREENKAAIDALNEEFAGVVEYFQRERIVEEALANYDYGWADVVAGVFTYDAVDRLRKQFLGGFTENLTDEERARLNVLRERGLAVGDLDRAIAEQLEAVQKARLNGIRDFILALKRGEGMYNEEFTQAATLIEQSGLLSKSGVATELARVLAEQEGDVTQEDVFRLLLERAGVDQAQIIDLLTVKQQQENAEFLAGMQKLADDLQKQQEQVRIALLEQELDRTEDLARSIELANEIGIANLEADLEKLSKKIREDFDKILVSFNVDTFEGVKDILSGALAGAGIQLDDVPGFSAVASGQAFIDAVNDAIDKSTTPEQAREIIEEQKAKYERIMQAYIDALIEAGTIDDAKAEAIRKAFATGVLLFEQKALEGIGEVESTIADIQERADRAAEKARRAEERRARDAERRAREAIRQARRLEDAFMNIARETLRAEEAYYRAVRGLGVGAREQAEFDLDVRGIAQEAERQITQLRRELEDISRNFSGSPEQLAQLTSEYENLIAAIERARDAEIAAASSFEEQMRRRSNALNLFQRDLQDVAFQSANTFDKVGAGIYSAFAEYQKDLVTLVDITRDAVTGVIDTFSTLVGDFIFDQENMWENFKKNMLRLSRQIVEGFTKAFVQQAISSLTGGPGSILGNQFQPSPYGSTGVPSVGTGGPLGRLFSGLFGGQQGSNGVEVLSTSSQVAATTLDTLTQAAASAAAAVSRIASAAGIDGIAAGAASVAGAPFTAIADKFAESGNALIDGIVATADALGVSARDLATVISYETGGTFDPRQAGPTTQWGQHRGLIQFGEPQAARFGVDFSTVESAINTQLGPDGAIVRYLKASGFEEGMDILDLYSTINAGAPGRYYASDAANGGAPGNVLEKVTEQFGPHYDNAERLLSGLEELEPAMADAADTIQTSMTGAAETLRTLPTDVAGFQPQYGAQQPYAPANAAVAGAADAFGLQGAGGLQQQGVQFQQMFTQFMTQTQATLTQFQTQFQAALQQVVTAIQAMATQVSAGGIFGGALGGFADGGLVRGAGTETSDSILAWLSNNEYVVRAKQAKEFMPLLEAINNGASKEDIARSFLGSRPAFADGGLVSSYIPSARTTTQAQPIVNNTRGDTITLQVSYVMNGGQGGTDRFRRSASQHAKQLLRQIERARRNT